MKKEDFIKKDPSFIKATLRLEKVRADLCGKDRWGDCRRFSGNRSANRLDRLEKARENWSKAYDAAECKWVKATKGSAT